MSPNLFTTSLPEIWSPYHRHLPVISNEIPNRTEIMAKFNLEPETSLSHVWVTATTTSAASMTGINFPSDWFFWNTSSIILTLKSFRHFLWSMRQRPNALSCHLRCLGIGPHLALSLIPSPSFQVYNGHLQLLAWGSLPSSPANSAHP